MQGKIKGTSFNDGAALLALLAALLGLAPVWAHYSDTREPIRHLSRTVPPLRRYLTNRHRSTAGDRRPESGERWRQQYREEGDETSSSKGKAKLPAKTMAIEERCVCWERFLAWCQSWSRDALQLPPRVFSYWVRPGPTRFLLTRSGDFDIFLVSNDILWLAHLQFFSTFFLFFFFVIYIGMCLETVLSVGPWVNVSTVCNW